MKPMGENIEGAINRKNIHQVEKRQHQPYPFKQVAGTRIAVFNHHRYRSENGVDDKEVEGAGGKTFEKTTYRTEDTRAEDQQVHEKDVRSYYPGEYEGFISAVALDRHLAKVVINSMNDGPCRMNQPDCVWIVEIQG
jgi:hypothetical protein